MFKTNKGLRITKFYTDICADIVYSYTGYDVTICFWSEVIARKLSKNSVSDGFGWNFARSV